MSFYNIVRQRTDSITSIIQSHLTDGFFLTFEPPSMNGAWYTKSTKQDGPIRLLILDSSFNPPTKAHAALLTKALETHPTGYFDASLLLFSSRNADKIMTGASVVERAQLMELVARKNTCLECPVYVGLTAQAKFVDKATEIQQWYQRQQTQHPLELHFILGYDTVTRLLDPKYYQPLTVKQALDPFFAYCYLICADRPGFAADDDDTKAFWQSEAVRAYVNRMTRISLADQTDIVMISSTLARQAAKGSHEDLVKFLDDAVADYVINEKLYQ